MTDEFSALCLERARELVRGRSIIVGGGNLAGSTRKVHALHELGAERCLVVATGVGTGPLPDPAEAESIVIELEAADMISEMRAVEAILDDPPPAAVSALDRFDPDHRALVLLAAVGTSLCIGDRPAYGARPASWTALEDKTLGDALFERAGVPRPPSRVVVVAACPARRGGRARPRRRNRVVGRCEGGLQRWRPRRPLDSRRRRRPRRGGVLRRAL